MKTKIFYDFEATSVSRDADPISVGLVAITEDKINIGDTIPDGFEVARNWKRRKCFIHQVKTFYAEFTDFNIAKCDDWVKKNVVSKLKLKYSEDVLKLNIALNKKIDGVEYINLTHSNNKEVLGNTLFISEVLKIWLSQFEDVEFWADYDTIDKPMLVDLIADWSKITNTQLYDKLQYEFGDNVDFDENWFNKEFNKHKIGLPKHLPNIQYYDFYDLHTMFKLKGIDTDISREVFSEIRQQIIPLPFSNFDTQHNALWDTYISYLCYEKLNKM